MRRSTQNRKGRERGQATVEAAISIIIVFVVTFWVFELAWLMYTYTVIADAANEGVRHAIVTSGGGGSGTQTCGGGPTGTAQVVCNFAKLSLHDVSALSVTVTFPGPPAGSTTPPNPVQVQVTYTYIPYLSTFMNPAPGMSAYAQGRMVVQ